MLLLTLAASVASGCSGSGGAVSVRWRIAERSTGALHDPRDVADASGTCCAVRDSQLGCAGQPGWHITRVRLELTEILAEEGTEQPLANPPAGLDAPCRSRELTTPFELPTGTFAVALKAFDPAAPDAIEAESPSAEIRTIHRAEIVSLDVVELSVE